MNIDLTFTQLLPQADVSVMLNNRLTLLLDDDLEKVQEAAEKLRARLPEIDIDRYWTSIFVVRESRRYCYPSFQVCSSFSRRSRL